MKTVRVVGWLSTLFAGVVGCGGGTVPAPEEVSSAALAAGDNARTLVMPWLADPEVYKENDDLFFLTGTGNGVVLPLYESNDLTAFRFKRDYNPSAADPTYDYCFLWAPDLNKSNGAYQLHFSAHRVPNGAACPPAGQEVTTFVATAPDLNLNFGAPQPLNANTTWPRTSTATGCLPQGCNRNIRIDSATYNDVADRWFFYVWFDRGNNISSFNMAAPGTVYNHAGPAVFATPAHEEGINEAPEVFKRNGIYYLLFSGGWYNSQYAMYYVMADSIPQLTRARAVRRLSLPLRNSAGKLVQSHGHNVIVERRGEYFNVFHVGAFDTAGNLTSRSTYMQRVGFKPDGAMTSLNQVSVRWNKLNGYSYSLDVVLRDGSVIGPCSSVALLGQSNKTVFDGVCRSAGDRVVTKGDIAAFRIFYAINGAWGAFVEKAYDGISDDVSLELPGGFTPFVDLEWNELQTPAQYSIDVQRRDTGAWIGPCIGVASVNKSLAWTYQGRCDTPGINVAPSNIQAFRICSAVNGDWAHARCGAAAYDGRGLHSRIVIP
ncbi:glycoside hydrolase [Corallococcus praedator]|uniref:Glycoside hydrolase n=1 Tax=Corallococcus praedator TaxID=2316724 RepID=A0ABX9QRJ3_9BACT|nr:MULTISPECIES: family 43 glycosylhydrolase [Corallococcus]RKH20659.1 glycoside hydrolase [Corallococcus sp. CA047B]RKH34841.1 glycoside hydrolase [Corallococcus sp. CA031C]RKI16756.1 glycoside hydrolase [Corallococcus praedator]